jgi:hypothetical protein
MGMDVYGNAPISQEGEYFRANLWGWRPIHYISQVANERFELGYDMSGWGYNDGKGLPKTKAKKLADAIEKLVAEYGEFQEPTDKIYICLGMWVEAGTGSFVGETENLDEVYPIGTLIHNSIVDSKGRHIEPAHSIDREFLNDWLVFLRNSGGFKIW